MNNKKLDIKKLYSTITLCWLLLLPTNVLSEDAYRPTNVQFQFDSLSYECTVFREMQNPHRVWDYFIKIVLEADGTLSGRKGYVYNTSGSTVEIFADLEGTWELVDGKITLQGTQQGTHTETGDFPLYRGVTGPIEWTFVAASPASGVLTGVRWGTGFLGSNHRYGCLGV